MNLETLKHRDGFGTWLNCSGLVGQGVEIGVANGMFSKIMLTQWQGKVYHMIDLWAPQDPNVYKESQTLGVWGTERDYEKWFDACKELRSQDPRVVLVRELSVNASKTYPDESLDFAYIDANHRREAVLEDLAAWYPKVKLGGLICGHDYIDKHDNGDFIEVKTALTEWNMERKYPMRITDCGSWWIIKGNYENAMAHEGV